MDKKNFLIGISLLILAFYLIYSQSEERQLEAEKRTTTETNASKNESIQRDAAAVPSLRPQAETNDNNSSQVAAPAPTPPKEEPREEHTIRGLALGENDPIEILFTSHGGAIREIRLKKTDRVLKEYSFKFQGIPALAISFDQGNERKGYEKRHFELVDDGNPTQITWVNRTENIEVRREYWRIEGQDPYLIHHRTTVTNHNSFPLAWKRVRLQVGSVQPIDRLYNLFDDSRTYLNIGYFNAGEELDVGCRCANCSGRIDGVEDEFWQINEFEHLDGIAKLEQEIADGDDSEETRKELERLLPSFRLTQAKWACVNNRFFVNVVRPLEEPRSAEVVARFNDLVTPEGKFERGLSCSFSFPFGSIGPGESRDLEIEYYAGPKDYTRLQALGHEQKTIMQFGIFWWVSEPLNHFLNLLHGWLGNFGWAIIIMTICVKLALWPLTAKSVRSQKKMRELQEPMQAIREKYKGNPQKLNQEMMKFYKEQGFNPMAGCWPMLIQMPIFLGLFWMLRSAAELQGAQFLWIEDLSEQDNLAFLGSFSLNLLPLFMVATQVIQMKLTPMNLGPGASEQQRIQAKMMRMMPYFFLFILYFFSSALVLYWTVQNILSIIQTLITNRSDPTSAPTITTNETVEKTKSLGSSQHISPEEREHRRALGLRLRGELTKKEIKIAFKDRIAKYHPDKIRNLRSKRQREAEAKREKLEKAYEFLLKR